MICDPDEELVRTVVTILEDPNPRRCQGLGKFCVRCKRTGEPVDGAFYCPDHEHQRAWFEGV